MHNLQLTYFEDKSCYNCMYGGNMIKSIEFENFRNLNCKYEFTEAFNVIVGKNSSGKTNLLEGIKLAISTIKGDYFKIMQSDFKDSDDTNIIKIKVEFNSPDTIPSFKHLNSKGEVICGFQLTIYKSKSGRFFKDVTLLEGSNISSEIYIDDPELPNLYSLPLIRVEDLYLKGLSVGINTFLENDDKYRTLKDDSKIAIKKEIETKEDEFKKLCKVFNQNLEVVVDDPVISNEKVFIVDGPKEHNLMIGAGYKSIANILLNTLDENFNIILLDEIENHLHPPLIRTLIRKLNKLKNIQIISTSHSSVVINELGLDNIIHISGVDISFKTDLETRKKLNNFLHPGRNELIMSDNIILVEGYTEELLLKHYLTKTFEFSELLESDKNWTVVNVAGVMFKPYILLGKKLNKKIIVISDTDITLNDGQNPSTRFKNLEKLCADNNVRLIHVENTLETDLKNNGYLTDLEELLEPHKKFPAIFVAKNKRKTDLVEKLIENEVNLDKWHVIVNLNEEISSN